MNNLSPTAFVKYHGNGNDFIVFELDTGRDARLYQIIIDKTKALCHRNRGIGADGVITLFKRDGFWHVTVINADGSMAHNCGNGLRVMVKYLAVKYRIDGPIDLHFSGRLFQGVMHGDEVAVDMGLCSIDEPGLFSSPNFTARFVRGEIGNRHVVFLLDGPPCNWHATVDDIKRQMPSIDDRNIGFLWRDGAGAWMSRVYERGVGFTQSCGTGAIMAAAFLARLGCDTTMQVVINQPGGPIAVTLSAHDEKSGVTKYAVVQQGNAEETFRGICQL